VSKDTFCTFVIPTRNDSYGEFSPEDFKNYLQVFVDQLSGSDRNFEINIVQWNNIEQNPCLSELKKFIRHAENVRINFFSVPKIFHDQILHSEKKPLCSEAAVNVGLRRATGKFCCVKVQDAFYSSALINWLRQGTVEHGRLYRAIRADHVVQRTLGFNERDLADAEVHRYQQSGTYSTNACGDFMLMSKDMFIRIRGWADPGVVVSTGSDGITLARAICHGLTETLLPIDFIVWKRCHPNMYRLRMGSGPPKALGAYILRIKERFRTFPPAVICHRVFLFLKIVVCGVTNLPDAEERGVPVDNFARYSLKFYFNLMFSRIHNGNSINWGLPDHEFNVH
jgi:hypothetical protein